MIFFLTENTIQPINLTTVLALENVTLRCLASVDDARYSWHRVNGHIPSHSQGWHNNTFTIHRITPINEGAYYCVVKKHGIIARSNDAFIAVDGKEFLMYIISLLKCALLLMSYLASYIAAIASHIVGY